MKRTKKDSPCEKIDEKKQSGFPILCCDPSLTAFGWAVVRNDKVLTSGCIKTSPRHKKLHIRKGDDDCDRIDNIAKALLTVIRTYNITYIVAEQPHGSQSSNAMKMVGIVLGILVAISNALDIGLEWYNESDSKLNALNKTEATKSEMVDVMKSLYSNWYREERGTKAINEAVADALAIHYLAKWKSPTIKFMLR